jgi:DNA-binding PadR family transcriptional regulator
MRINPHRTPTPLALMILDLLHERAMHPYELHQTMRDRYVDQVVKVSAGALYHTVERLERAGHIAPVQTGRAGRRPERTIYAITEAGRDEFRLNLRDLVRLPAHEYPVFAAAVQILDALTRFEAVDLLEQRVLAREAEIAAQEQVIASLAKDGLARVHILAIEYALAVARAELAFVRDLADDIRTGSIPLPEQGEQPHDQA